LNNNENGAQITAIFSANSMNGLRWKILKGMALLILLVFIFAFIVALFLGKRISKPIPMHRSKLAN